MLTLLAGALLAPLLLVSLWNAFAAPRLRAAPRAAAGGARASLLIPARDEAPALAAALPEAVRDAAAAEILVLDDESTDATASVVQRAGRELDSRVRLLHGAPLPAGWLGKNWACHQLAAAASGDVLIFCDADVTLTGDAVAATLFLMERTGADVLTALPRQRYAGWWDAATIPLLLHFPLLGTLPLPLVARSRSRALVFGNGQWLAFRRAAYERMGGHAAVRRDVVEDMALVRRARGLGLRIVPALAPDLLTVRMYHRPRELFAGFAKNLYPLLGATLPRAAAALAFFLVLTVLPLALAIQGALLPLALLAATRVLHALTTRASLTALLLHPLGVLLASAAALRSIIVHHTGSITWKSRRIEPSRTAPANT